MFLESPITLLLENFLEQEDFDAIEGRLQDHEPLSDGWLSVQWFRVTALQIQSKPSSAFSLCEYLIDQIPDERSLLFQLKHGVLSFYNGRPISDVPEQVNVFLAEAESAKNPTLIRSWAYRFAALCIEIGIELGILSVTRASTALAYHANAARLLKSGGYMKSYYMTLNKEIALKQKHPWLSLPPAAVDIARFAREAARQDQLIQQAELWLWQADILWREGKNQNHAAALAKAGQLFKQAEQLLLQAGHRHAVAKVQERQGMLLLDYADASGLGMLEAAAIAYEEAGRLYKASPLWDRLNNWYTNAIEPEKAAHAAAKYKSASAAIEMPPESGSAEIALLKKALDEDDMDAVQRIGHGLGAGAAWVSLNIYQILSNALATTGRIGLAIDFSSRAVEILQPSKSHHSLAHAHLFLADMYVRKGDFEDAYLQLDNAAANYDLLSHSIGLGTVVRRRLEYQNQYTAHTRQQTNFTAAFSVQLEKVVTDLEKTPTQQSFQVLGGILQALAQTNILRGLNEEAASLYEEAEKLYEENHLRLDLANLWPHFTLFLIGIARKEQSVSIYDQALGYASKAIQYLPKGQKQILFRVWFHQGLCYYESGRLLSGAEQQERYLQADESFESAATLIEQLLGLLDNTSVSNRQQAIAAFLADKQELYEQAFILNYIFRYDHLRALRWAHPQKMQSVLLEMAQELPAMRTSPVQQAKKFSYADFQEALLQREKSMNGRRIVVCEFYCIQENIYLFLMRSDWSSPHMERVPLKVSEVRERQEAFMADNRLIRDAAEGGRKKWWQALKPLVRMAELSSQLGDLIYLMPHGALQNLPLQTLELSDGRALIDRNPVMWSPSASILYQVWQRNKQSGMIPPDCLAMGDTRNNLPWAKAEAEELSVLFGHRPLTGDAATKTVFLEALSRVSLLHFSGHGHFASGNGMDSYLEFPGGETLSPAEVMDKKVKPGMTVVLSGCETGINQTLAGGELMGFSRGFIVAGVDSLMVSLWAISDQSTRTFFKLYYAYLLNGIDDKAQALWFAVRDMKQQGYAFFEWGAFMINGDF